MNDMKDVSAQAQAFLFVEGGSLSLQRLAHLLGVQKEDVVAALDSLETRMKGSGLSLVRTETEVSLAASSETTDAIKDVYEKELARDIGPAGLEVIAIVLYRGSSTRGQIDHIRGVNSASTIRLLLSRGLLERMGNPGDAREYVYRPTTELLAHLGVRHVKELPDYATIAAELAAFEEDEEDKQPSTENHGNRAYPKRTEEVGQSD